MLMGSIYHEMILNGKDLRTFLENEFDDTKVFKYKNNMIISSTILGSISF